MASKIRDARHWVRSLSACALVLSRTAQAQSPGSVAEDRARLAAIVGDTAQPPLAAVRLSDLPVIRHMGPAKRVPLELVFPEVRLIWNSDLPYSMNDGPLWAGHGWNVSASGGVGLTRSYKGVMVRAVVAPAILYSQNAPFQIFANTTPDRSAYANPFHGPQASLDLPHRFGDRRMLTFDPGRSGLSLEWNAVAAGVTSENEWWGPGMRNALIMSNNAPGVPRYFVRTAAPLRTRMGSLDAKLISGTLTQSLYFSPTASENRTLSGALIRLRPAFDSALTLGFARVVYAPIGPFASPFTMTLARSFDALFRWENLETGQRSDQIASIFARWIVPRTGFEVYGEWARMDLPRHLTELLTAAHHTGGYTLGFQWAQRKRGSALLRLQSEITYLEQSRVFPDRPPPDFYSGRASPQGFTQRGQVIGAAIGPGASSQWIGLDWIARRWQLGGIVGRIRWDNDALYRQVAPSFWDHDVSLLSGIRAGWRAPLTDFSAELTVSRRYNYLFQNGRVSPGGYRTVDVQNLTLALTATPR